MYTYRKVVSYSINPNHATRIEPDPPLREEDISFYGLLTFAFSNGIYHPDDLPGTKVFTYTSHDRGILSKVISTAGIRNFESELEICTMRPEDPTNLVSSDFYTFDSRTQHGLRIASHSVGVCTVKTS